VQDKMVGREIDRGRLAETIRSNQAGEALQQRGQDITVRGQNISAKNAELSREIQRAELQDKVLDRQIARETNQIKLDELKQKQADVRQKAEIARADRQAAAQGAVDTFSTALDSLNEIEQSPGLSKAVGIRSAFPTVPGSDAANFEARLDTFKAQTFLPMVQSLKGMGALSDAEGKKLSDAVGALSPKMSEKAFRESIGKIRNQLESKLSTVKKQFDYQEPVQNMPGKQSPAGSNFSSLWGD
ncbi:phage DNA ejection protein, partial [Salmonella enterica]